MYINMASVWCFFLLFGCFTDLSQQQMPKANHSTAENNKSNSRILLVPLAYGMNSRFRDQIYLTQLLINDGYDVTVLVNSDDVGSFKDVHDNSTSGGKVHYITYPYPKDTLKFTDPALEKVMTSENSLESMNLVLGMYFSLCDIMMDTAEVRQALESAREGTAFDLLIMDICDTCSRILVSWLDLPTIGMTSYETFPDIALFPEATTISPGIMMPFTNEMTYIQRVMNTVGALAFFGYFRPQVDVQAEQFVRDKNIVLKKPLKSSLSDAMLLVSNNFVFDYPRPYMPNVMLVSGWYIKPTKPIQGEMEKFVSVESDGIIFVTFGTLVSKAAVEKRQLIADAFKRFPTYRIIWKTGGDPVDISSNVLQTKWAPQTDLLADPRMRLFITHAGAHSCYEALHFGVPVVSIPLFADQPTNSIRLTQRIKMGVHVDFYSITTDLLASAISEVLTNTTYRDNAADASEQYHELIPSPIDKILSAVDFVIKYKGIGYLASKPLSYYNELQLYGVDVMLFIATVIVMLMSIIIAVICVFIQCVSKCIRSVVSTKQKSE